MVHLARLIDGTRRVTSISEVLGVKDEQVELQDLFLFERTGITPSGKVLGKFQATGLHPICMDRLKACGIHLSESIFREVHEIK